MFVLLLSRAQKEWGEFYFETYTALILSPMLYPLCIPGIVYLCSYHLFIGHFHLTQKII